MLHFFFKQNLSLIGVPYSFLEQESFIDILNLSDE